MREKCRLEMLLCRCGTGQGCRGFEVAKKKKKKEQSRCLSTRSSLVREFPNSGRSYRLNKVEGKKAKGLFESRTQVIG